MADTFDPRQSAFSAPPPFWESHVPRYRASRDLVPSEKRRVRFETPFSELADPDVWQYAHKPVARGTVIETKDWPHPSMKPLNYSGFRVQQFFNAASKSRRPWRPWRFDRVVLDDGLTGSMAPRISMNSGVTASDE